MNSMTSTIDTLTASIDALQPADERTASVKFIKLFPNIERALARGVTQRAVMETLERDGLKLHPVKFKKLLEQARAQRNENGGSTCCPACGSIPVTSTATEAQIDEGSEK